MPNLYIPSFIEYYLYYDQVFNVNYIYILLITYMFNFILNDNTIYIIKNIL